MTLFKALLIIILTVLSIYTLYVGSLHGWNLLPVFFEDIGRFNWPGQFNLDFTFMLSLSALWTAWRNRFTPTGLGLGGLALIGGSLFLSIYLLYLLFKHHGNIKEVLLGSNLNQP